MKADFLLKLKKLTKMKRAIETMDCKFCGRPVTLINRIGESISPGHYDSLKLIIMQATCKHFAICDEDGKVFEQHEDIPSIQKEYKVVYEGQRPYNYREFQHNSVEPNKSEKI